MPEFRNNLHDWQREQLGVGPQYQSDQYRATGAAFLGSMAYHQDD